MKFQVGDKVKFLNQVGGGMVVKILGPTMVEVATEDGFNIPTLTNELILAEYGTAAEKLFQQDFQVETPQPEPQPEEDDELPFDRISPLSKYSSLKPAKDGIYVVYQPQNKLTPTMGDIDIYIVNKTLHTAIYSLFLTNIENGNQLGMDYGMIDPMSKVYVETVDRSRIELWTEGALQVLFHADEYVQLPQPVNAPFKVKGSRFLHENAYETMSFMDGKAIVVAVYNE